MSALKHFFIYYYDYNYFSTVPNLVIHHFCVLTARHVSANQERQKNESILWTSVKELERVTYFLTWVKLQKQHIYVQYRACNLVLNSLSHNFLFNFLYTPFSKNLHLSLCVCVQCSVNLNVISFPSTVSVSVGLLAYISHWYVTYVPISSLSFFSKKSFTSVISDKCLCWCGAFTL